MKSRATTDPISNYNNPSSNFRTSTFPTLNPTNANSILPTGPKTVDSNHNSNHSPSSIIGPIVGGSIAAIALLGAAVYKFCTTGSKGVKTEGQKHDYSAAKDGSFVDEIVRGREEGVVKREDGGIEL